MRILHCCLAAIYVEGFGYQENILPRMHKFQGHDVMILASTEIIKPGEGYVYTVPSKYINEDGISVVRIPYRKILSQKVSAKIRSYKFVYETLDFFQPDIVFMHDAQTAAVFPIIRYLKNNRSCRLYVDSHTDFVNSAKSLFSKYLLHGLLYKWYVRKTIPYARKYYGTLPARVQFYRDFYGTPAEKTEYLPLGVDDITVPMSMREDIKAQVRKDLRIPDNAFVIVSGGKLETRKNTILLLEAYEVLSKKYNDMYLLLFGSVSMEIKQEFDMMLESNTSIIHKGWVSSKETYKYFFASDLACFPGTHSTLWEEAVGYGVPSVFKYWEGISQIDLNGNCILLKSPLSVSSLVSCIESIYLDKTKYDEMKLVAMTKGVERFSYSKIANYSINQ